MLVSRIDTHLEDAVSRLLSQYGDTERLEGLLRVLCGETQAIEDALFSLDAGRRLATAQGAQLDGIAEIVGARRNGASDNILRALIAGAVAQNNSDGTAGDLTSAVAAMYQSSAVFRRDASSTGQQMGETRAVIGFAVGSPQTDPSFFPQVQQMLAGALPSGVALESITLFDADGAFAMDGPQAWVQGFGDVNDTTAGGPMAELSYANPLV